MEHSLYNPCERFVIVKRKHTNITLCFVLHPTTTELCCLIGQLWPIRIENSTRLWYKFQYISIYQILLAESLSANIFSLRCFCFKCIYMSVVSGWREKMFFDCTMTLRFLNVYINNRWCKFGENCSGIGTANWQVRMISLSFQILSKWNILRVRQ